MDLLKRGTSGNWGAALSQRMSDTLNNIFRDAFTPLKIHQLLRASVYMTRVPFAAGKTTTGIHLGTKETATFRRAPHGALTPLPFFRRAPFGKPPLDEAISAPGSFPRKKKRSGWVTPLYSATHDPHPMSKVQKNSQDPTTRFPERKQIIRFIFQTRATIGVRRTIR